MGKSESEEVLLVWLNFNESTLNNNNQLLDDERELETFSLPPAAFRSILLFICIVMFVAGFIGNCAVLLIPFARWNSARKPPSQFLMYNLAIADILIVMINFPILIYNNITQSPIGFVGCQLYGFIGGLCGTVSIVTQTLIALDRYSVVVHPFTALETQNGGRFYTNLGKIIGTWLYALVFAAPPVIGFPASYYIPDGTLLTCSLNYSSTSLSNKIYIIGFFIGAYTLPLSLIVRSYTSIYVSVVESENSEFIKTSRRRMQDMNSSRSAHGKEEHLLEIQIAKTCFMAVNMWVIGWTPFATVALMRVYFEEDHNQSLVFSNPFMSLLPSLMAKTSCCINPFLFTLRHPTFRKEVVTFLEKHLKGFHTFSEVTRNERGMSTCT